MPVTTKLNRVVTYDDENSPTMSLDPLTTRSHEVTRQIETSVYPLLKGL